MPPRGLMSSFAFAALAATASLLATPQAQAQGLFEFLWGGGQEWGGSKQNVSFDAKYTPGQIIVSFGDRRLYLITKAGQAMSYPIAVPREQSRWQGATTVTDKRMNPSWRPTPEMLRENPKLPLWVPGGHRMNPLGVRAMYLGSSLYRIHGTDAPWTIGQAVSKGCIRMLNEDVQDLYPRVPVGTKVTVTWQRFGSQAVASGDEPAPFSPTGFLRRQPTSRPGARADPPAHAVGGCRGRAQRRSRRRRPGTGGRCRETDRAQAGQEGRGSQEARGRSGCRSRYSSMPTPWRSPRRPPPPPPRLPRPLAPPPKLPRRLPRTPRMRSRASRARAPRSKRTHQS